MSDSDGQRSGGSRGGQRGGLAGCLLVGVSLFFLGFLVIAVVGWFLLKGLISGDGDELADAATEKIAHIDIDGIIASADAADLLFGSSGESMVDRIKEQLKRAIEDESVKAIVLRINSPGGEVTASDTIYNAVLQAREKKPVVVFMDAMAASGGYYVACGATEIFAGETTLTGSIGVIIQSISYGELMGKVGVETRTFKSGEFKDMLSGSREMTEAERELVDGLVMEMYGRFVGIVAEARNIPEQKLRTEIADGRVFTGRQAHEVGLVDSNGYIEDAYARARELGKTAADAPVIKMNESGGFFEALGLARGKGAVGNVVPARIEVDVADRLLPRLQPGLPYLLPEFLVP
jgi:protease-4